ARLAQRVLQEDAPVEGLMLLADSRGTDMRVKVCACDVAQSYRHIGQFRKTLGADRISDEAIGINDNLAARDLRLQQIGESINGGRGRIVGGGNTDADGAGKASIEVDAEYPRIRRIIEPIS